MMVNLQAQGLWQVMSTGEGDYREDRNALAALLRAVPLEMQAGLARKASAFEAWESIKDIRVGVERVKEANAERLRQDFAGITFKPGETVEDFAMRITTLANQLRVLGDNVTDKEVVKKMLHTVPDYLEQVAISIETLLDLSTISIEEATGRLRAVEQRKKPASSSPKDSGERLLLTEEEWMARLKLKEGSGGSSSGSGSRGKKRGKGKGRGGRNSTAREGRNGDACLNCGKEGHWAKDCRSKKKGGQAHVAQDDEPTLMLVEADSVQFVPPPPPPPTPALPPPPTAKLAPAPALTAMTTPVCSPSTPAVGTVHLVEEKVFAQFSDDGDKDHRRWILDTGATNHMTGSRSAFSDLDTNIVGTVRFGDGSVVEIKGIGTLLFSCKSGEHRTFAGVYFIPKLTTNILSLGQLDEIGYQIVIDGGVIKIRDVDRRLLCKVPRSPNRLYCLDLNIAQPVCLTVRGAESAWLWHARFGHLNFPALRKLARDGWVRGMPEIEHVDQLCGGCLAGKHRRTPFPQRAEYRAEQPLELVHGDLCGPITPTTPSGNRYFILLVDDCSRFMWIQLLPSKDRAADAIKQYQQAAEAETGRKLQAFRSDRGGEFTSADFAEHCAKRGVRRQLTAPYTPQQNGVVERRNQTVVATARSMLKAKGLPGKFWGEAVSTAVYLLNRSPTKSVQGKTPFESWYGKKPAVHHLRTFGCVVHVKLNTPNMKKLDDRSKPMIFIGYERGSKAYRAYDPTTGRVHVTRDLVFDEQAQWKWDADGEQGEQNDDTDTFMVEEYITVTQQAPADEVEEEAEDAAPGGSTPPHTLQHPTTAANDDGAKPVEYATPPADLEGALDADHDDDVPIRFRKLDNILGASSPRGLVPRVLGEELHAVSSADEPASFADAERDPSWRKAMLEEMQSIEDNHTWSLADLPHGRRAIGLKWVFKVKRDERGAVAKHKARLVVKGYAQRHGIDYDEVFAPVARLDSVRLLLALAAHEGWQVHHMDVKSAFLNGDLQEVVYVQQPEGFISAGNEGKVLKLRKALYGLHQAPRAWYAKLDATLASLGFTRSASEPAIYTRGDSGKRLVVGVYVDDLVITGNRSDDIDSFKAEMARAFRMSDLGLLHYYLGIEVKQSTEGISLSQGAYAAKILEKSGMAGCNPCHVPMEQRLKLSKSSTEPLVDATAYRSIVGSLRYLVNTRPDLAFAVGYVSRFLAEPHEDHLVAVKHILRYVAGTSNWGLWYGRKEEVQANLTGFSDSDFAGDVDTRKSTTGVVFSLSGSPITWQSMKQKVVAQSSCEAEYIAAANATCQALWLARVLSEVQGNAPCVPKLMVDNKSAIALTKNPVLSGQSKHIEVKYHLVRESAEEGLIEVEFIRTEDQLGDILTKALGRVKFQELRTRIGLINVGSLHDKV